MDDDTAAVLASVVPLGETPSPQAQELAAAVARHVSSRPAPPPPRPRSLGERLCQVWGIDPNKVTRITIEITPDTQPTVNIEMLADDGLGFLLVPYRLEEA